ncbi:MAG: HpcH/HpaI aldolase family protein [Opitutaceae bacterium]
MIAGVGLDFVFIDTEHIALDRGILSWMCQTYAALGLPPLVRIPAPDPFAACMALDGGAAGIVAPYVETVEQVQALRGAVKLRPLKGARLAAALRDEASLEPELQSYLERYNSQNTLVINIESTPAVERLDELLSVPGVDAVLIGPHDLSCSLGIPEQYEHRRFEETICRIVRVARQHGVGVGIHAWMGIERFVPWAGEGLNIIIHSADVLAMRDKLRLAGVKTGSLQESECSASSGPDQKMPLYFVSLRIQMCAEVIAMGPAQDVDVSFVAAHRGNEVVQVGIGV